MIASSSFVSLAIFEHCNNAEDVEIVSSSIPFLKNQKQETVKKILNFLDNYDLPSIIFGLIVLVCTWMFFFFF